MRHSIEELTLLLLYMTSWEEEELPDGFRQSWKGYSFDALDELRASDWIRGANKSKSLYLTPEGIEKAEELKRKYLGTIEDE